MELRTLLNMLEIKSYNLALQLAVDPELNDAIEIADFKPEYYSAEDIAIISNCIDSYNENQLNILENQSSEC